MAGLAAALVITQHARPGRKQSGPKPDWVHRTMHRRLALYLLLLPLLTLVFSSCRYYRQDIVFRIDDEADKAYIKQQVGVAERQYRVRKNDFIEFQLFTNGGELLIDPNAELGRQLQIAGATGANVGQPGAPGQAGAMAGSGRSRYLVTERGDVLLPMVGLVPVENLNIRQLDSVLAQRYSAFYQNCFVLSRVANRRCVLFTAVGAGAGIISTPVQGRIVLLENENTSLIEVLASAGSIGVYSQMQRIRIIRGDLSKPEVQVVDLTHIHSLAKADLIIRPNDIIYVEPGRRPTLDVLRDIGTVGNLITGTAGLFFIVYITLRNQP